MANLNPLKMFMSVSVLVLLVPTQVLACSCVTSDVPAPCGTLKEGGPLFVGTILHIEEVPRNAGDVAYLRQRKVRVRIDEPFAGVSGGEPEVFTGFGGGDCGVGFKVGDQWLIAPTRSGDGRLTVSICSGTTRADHAAATLRRLRAMRDGGRVPSLTGLIVRYEGDLLSNYLNAAPERERMANVLIRIKSKEQFYETTSDDTGVYAFYAVPEGSYRFEAELPAGLTLGTYIGNDSLPEPVELVTGSCDERNLDVFASGSIQGRVLDATGKPVSYARVYLVPFSLQALPDSRGTWESQSKDGFFQFNHVSSGEYLLIVNPAGVRDPSFPYPTTFYPGVQDRSLAKAISLRQGEGVADANIRLPEPFKSRRLRVRVVWENGNLVTEGYPHVKVDSYDGSLAFRVRHPNIHSGEFELLLVPMADYELRASVTCLYWDGQPNRRGKRFESAPVYLSGADYRDGLTIQVEGTGCPENLGKSR